MWSTNRLDTQVWLYNILALIVMLYIRSETWTSKKFIQSIVDKLFETIRGYIKVDRKRNVSI